MDGSKDSADLQGKRTELVTACCVAISKAIGMEVCVCEQIEAALHAWEDIVTTEVRVRNAS